MALFFASLLGLLNRSPPNFLSSLSSTITTLSQSHPCEEEAVQEKRQRQEINSRHTFGYRIAAALGMLLLLIHDGISTELIVSALVYKKYCSRYQSLRLDICKGWKWRDMLALLYKHLRPAIGMQVSPL